MAAERTRITVVFVLWTHLLYLQCRTKFPLKQYCLTGFTNVTNVPNVINVTNVANVANVTNVTNGKCDKAFCSFISDA